VMYVVVPMAPLMRSNAGGWSGVPGAAAAQQPVQMSCDDGHVKNSRAGVEGMMDPRAPARLFAETMRELGRHIVQNTAGMNRAIIGTNLQLLTTMLHVVTGKPLPPGQQASIPAGLQDRCLFTCVEDFGRIAEPWEGAFNPVNKEASGPRRCWWPSKNIPKSRAVPAPDFGGAPRGGAPRAASCQDNPPGDSHDFVVKVIGGKSFGYYCRHCLITMPDPSA
jgi:hypothetical protein